MLERIIIFIKYHNALPLGLMVLFLGFGGALAKNKEFHEVVGIQTAISEEAIVNQEKITVEPLGNSLYCKY